MKKFKFRLATLQKLRENLRDERRGHAGRAHLEGVFQLAETDLAGGLGLVEGGGDVAGGGLDGVEVGCLVAVDEHGDL